MNRLIRSEIRKVVTTRWFKITMAVTAVLAIISPVITTLSAKSGEDIASTDFIHKVLVSQCRFDDGHAGVRDQRDGR